jgi:hypothetical protein
MEQSERSEKSSLEDNTKYRSPVVISVRASSLTVKDEIVFDDPSLESIKIKRIGFWRAVYGNK